MHIIFEEHQYDADIVKDVLRDISALQDVEKKVCVSYVGYFYSPTVMDCVFILPKVLLKDESFVNEEGKKMNREIIADVPKYTETITNEDGTTSEVSRSVTPEDIITKEGQEKYLSKEYRKFIYEFSVWVYRSLCVYKKKNPDSKAIYFKQLPQRGNGKRHEANTFLDIILSLIRFNQENQDYFMFTIRNIHSGMNKINWTRTISHSQAFLQKEAPIYLDPVNKKRQINFDEELFVIFFSILNHLNEKYGFRTPINFQYELINQRRFDQYLNGYGQTRLRQIKYKYFSDKALILWDLCYAFFNSAHKIAVNTDQREYLLAKSFEIVFEAMIDDLIGSNRSDIPKGLKDQHDGKRVDHMYAYDALTRSDEDNTNDQVYYIGDSKYYKNGSKLGRESIYKQYTYARNVIQWNIDLFMNTDTSDMTEDERKDYDDDKARFGKVKIRKSEDEGNFTEGYNVIPNFFISAFVDKDRRYDAGINIRHHMIKKDGKEVHSTHISYQFENRLFDRDTLILSHYDVNFLYVIYLYSRNKTGEKVAWRNSVRDLFRDEIRSVIENEFEFYAMTPHDGDPVGMEYIKANFQKVLGKIYTPYDNKDVLAVALSKADSERKNNEELLEELRKYFYVTNEPVKLGYNPEKAIKIEKDNTGTITHQRQKEGILVGMVRDDKQWQWVKDESKYNIRQVAEFERKGTMQITREVLMVNRIVIYKKKNNEIEYLGMFPLADMDSIPSSYSYDDMQNFIHPYPFRDSQSEEERKKNKYIIYEIDIDSPLPLSEMDKRKYEEWIKQYGRDEKGRIGKPFIV